MTGLPVRDLLLYTCIIVGDFAFYFGVPKLSRFGARLLVTSLNLSGIDWELVLGFLITVAICYELFILFESTFHSLQIIQPEVPQVIMSYSWVLMILIWSKFVMLEITINLSRNRFKDSEAVDLVGFVLSLSYVIFQSSSVIFYSLKYVIPGIY